MVRREILYLKAACTNLFNYIRHHRPQLMVQQEDGSIIDETYRFDSVV